MIDEKKPLVINKAICNITEEEIKKYGIRRVTIEILKDYALVDETEELIAWTPGQIVIIDCILNRSSPDGKNRVQIIASTRYGKSLAVGAAVSIRASLKPEKWAIVAGTKEKARIIMEYVTMFSLDCPAIRTQLKIETSLESLRMRRSQDRLTYKRRGEVRVYSADAKRVSETSTSLMGFGSPNVIGDESALIPDTLQATIMRMLGDKPDNFLVKIGNPFNRNHFLRTWRNDRYYKIFIDYNQAIKEGRYTKEYIEEMKEEALFDILYGCLFPAEGTIDSKGWLTLLTDSEIERAFVDEDIFLGDKRLGGDIAGGGRNYSVMTIRSYNYAEKVYKENEPDTMVYAGNIVSTATKHGIKDEDIAVDKVGIGRGAYDRLRELKGERVQGISAGETASEAKRFANLRAEMYWRAREWVLHGGKLKKDDDWYQLADIKYKTDSSSKVKIMSKEEMLREAIDSPDVADSFSLTFVKRDIPPAYQGEQEAPEAEEPQDDPYDL